MITRLSAFAKVAGGAVGGDVENEAFIRCNLTIVAENVHATRFRNIDLLTQLETILGKRIGCLAALGDDDFVRDVGIVATLVEAEGERRHRLGERDFKPMLLTNGVTFVACVVTGVVVRALVTVAEVGDGAVARSHSFGSITVEVVGSQLHLIAGSIVEVELTHGEEDIATTTIPIDIECILPTGVGDCHSERADGLIESVGG